MPIITTLTTIISIMLLAVSFTAKAQPQTARIGVISTGSPAASVVLFDAFRQRLRELGHVEGRGLAIEARYAADQPERFRALAAELVGLRVHVIVAGGTLATRAAKEVTSTTPIVMVTVGDAVGAGLVKSLPKPGGNITGQSFMGTELAVKGLDVLTEALPQASRFAVLFNPEIAGETFRAVETAARARGVALQPIGLRGPADLNQALASMNKRRPNALLVFALSANLQRRIVEFAAKNRLPALYSPFREAVDAGGLMSIGPKLVDQWRGAANYVDKILRGAEPGDLPVEQPTTFDLVINLRAANALGLTVPAAVLARADQVIE